ncbi:MAG TPA: von Willebrand factor type A domain-containing protein [Thermoanaerobaculia bacterium]|nr:von Willebrand factor type A domain-containing protein [Thermoanaerobaculia bacterium]
MSRLSERKVREIARRLGESPSYGPPAGLLEKIKSEIPPEVTVGAAFNARRSAVPRQRWLIAASLVAAVGAGLVGLRTWESRQAGGLEKQALRQVAAPQSPAAPQPVPPATSGAPQRLSPPPPPPPAVAQLQREEATAAPVTQEVPKPEPELRKELDSLGEAKQAQRTAPAVPESPPAPPAPPAASSGNLAGAERQAEARVEGSVVVGGVAGGAPAGAPSKKAQDAPEAQPPVEALRLDSGAPRAKAERPRSGAAFRFQRAGADPFVDTEAYRLSTFGLHVDTASYEAARRDLLAGRLPDPDSVRVEEWVNAFDYGDPAPARRDFALRAEGAPPPFAHGPGRRLLRFNVKARQAKAGEPDGAIVAGSAGAQVEFNSVVVARYRLLGYEGLPAARPHETTAAAGQIGAGQSVTALYEIELRPDAPRWEQPVATLRLYYREAGGRYAAQELRRVGFQDLAPAWEQASPGLRLASLVAELAEILKGSPWTRGDDLRLVARRLQEVAREFPGNARVAELAELAARAARLKASAP